MAHRFCYFGLMVVTLSVMGRCEWVPLKNNASQPGAPRVILVRDDQTATVLKVEVSGFEVNRVVSDAQAYKSVGLLTGAFTTQPGYPELPCVTKILAVPDRAVVSIEVVETGDEVVFAGYALPPARRPWKEGTPEPPYVEREDAYQSSSAYPQQAAVVDSPSVFRDFRIARVAVYPVRYVAARKELRIASSVTVRITYGPGDGANPKTSSRKPIAPSFATLYRSSIFNYQSVLERDFGGLETGRDVLLCISPDAFVSNLTPFANWRHKTGTFVKVTKFSDIGANATNPDIIKNYLAQVYHNWEYPPTYVLLVGDHGQIPIRQIAYDYTIVSENYYVEIDGNDFLPEMMIGRFTHEGVAAEQVIVNKIVGYERNPEVANTAWFKKGVVAANDEYISQIETKRFARERMMVDGRFTTVDTFMNNYPCNSSLADLINVLSNGRSFLNYRGEGWYTGWAASCYYFQTSDVQSVNNGRMLTFVTSIGCGVGAFNQSSCFGEQWLELGTVAAPRGAVTFIGPTSNTHTAYNNKIDIGIYMGMFQEGMETPGQALARGRLHMYEVFGNEHWVEYQTRVYCILGDPSVHIWKEIPRSVTVSHAASIPIGFNQVEITVTDAAAGTPVRDAQVCLAGDSVFAVGFTDAEGNVTIPVTPEFVDTLTVLVRGGNVIPYEGMQTVFASPEHVAPLSDAAVVDVDGNQDGMINPNENGRITFTLKNWGTQTASNVQATLSVADTSTVRVESAPPVSFGDLAPGASQVGAPFSFFVKPDCPVGDTIPFLLHVTSASQSWEYVQFEDVKGCKLKYTQAIVDDRGYPRSNARMDPGERVKLYLAVCNTGEDVAPNVQAVLRCASPYISIIDSVGGFGTMGRDTSVINYIDYFVVEVDSLCPTHTVIPYTLFLYSQGGLYPYAHVDSITLPVSVPRRSDPTGPDSYGYYAYASDDTLFQQAPKFVWTELNGIGTQVTGAGGNFTSTVNLPFTFRYYGVNYSQVRLSSDGWIAFGSGTQIATTNYPLPHNDAINCMVAAFWEDLFASTGETGRLLYFNDLALNRFIIEWYNVGHRTDATKKETFQIILYDLSYYPTATGDGEIRIQYRNTAEPGSNTIGIENHTQTLALQYTYNESYDESATPLRDSLAILFTTRTPELAVGVKEDETGNRVIPNGYVLDQNYPNPFNPQTTISYSLPHRSHTVLQIYSLTGQLVRTLFDGDQAPGQHMARWDGMNDRGYAVGSGMYFCRIHATSDGGERSVFVQTRKLLLLR